MTSNFKPNIVPKIHIADEETMLSSIRKEHTIEIYVKENYPKITTYVIFGHTLNIT